MKSVPLQVAFENGVKFGVTSTCKTATLTHGDLNAGKWNASLNVNIKAEANKYIFKFDGNGATSGTMADTPSSFGKEFILPECAFTKEYYTFEHYNLYKIENGVKKYYYMKEGTLGDSSEYRKWYEKGKQPEGWTISRPIPGSDIYSKVYNINDGETLYIEAQWEANRLTVNYHADGATKYKDPNDGEVIKDITGKDIILTKEYLHNVQYNNGFIDSNRFSGKDYFNTNTNNWKSNKDSTTSINASNSGTGKELAEDVGLDLSKGNITADFYPDWQMNVGTMHFYPNGGNNKGFNGSTIVGSGEYAGSLSWLQGFNYKSTSGNTVLDVLTLFEKTGYHTSSIQAWHLGSANSNEYIKDQDENLSRFVKDSTNVHLKLYANWIPNTWTVKYDSNGGTGTMTDTYHTYQGSVKLRPNSFTKIGYTFDGWYASRVNNGKTEWLYGNSKLGWADQWYEEGKQPEGLVKYRFGNEESSTITTYINNDILTLHAQWKANANTKYTVNHHLMNLDGTTYTKDSTVTNTGTTDSSITLSSLKKTYTGFTYANAKVGGVVTDKTTILADGSRVVDLYYTRNKYYLDLNGYLDGNIIVHRGLSTKGSILGSGLADIYVNDVKVASQVNDYYTMYYYGSTYEVKNITAMPGRKFDGIASNSMPLKGTIQAKANNVNLSFSTIDYNITYNLNGGTVTGNPTTYTVDDTITLKNPTKTGYTFAGWTGTGLSSASTNVSIAKGSTGDRSYVANWTPNTYTYNIKYISSSGKSLGTSTVAGTYGSSKEVTPPAKTGYTSPSAQTVKFDSTSAKTITFTYTPVTYNITYNLGGGSVSGNPTSYNVESEDITLKNPVKTGHTFTGWTGSNGSTPQKTVTITSGSTGNKTYTANYSVNTYKATFDANGGSNPNPAFISKTYGSQLGNLPVSTKTGYTFDGWYTSKSGGTKISATTTMGASDVTYYAHWTPNTYTYNIKYVSSSGKSLGTSTVQVNLVLAKL